MSPFDQLQRIYGAAQEVLDDAARPALRLDEVDTLPAIAERLGFSPNALRNHSYRHSSFPPPVRTYGKSEVYEIAAVADWIAAWRILHEGA